MERHVTTGILMTILAVTLLVMGFFEATNVLMIQNPVSVTLFVETG